MIWGDIVVWPPMTMCPHTCRIFYATRISTKSNTLPHPHPSKPFNHIIPTDDKDWRATLTVNMCPEHVTQLLVTGLLISSEQEHWSMKEQFQEYKKIIIKLLSIIAKFHLFPTWDMDRGELSLSSHSQPWWHHIDVLVGIRFSNYFTWQWIF